MKFVIEIEIGNALLREEAKEWLDNHFKSKGFFSICLIDKMLDHLNIKGFADSRVYTYLYSLHCVKFRDMKPATLDKVKEICYGLLACTEEPAEIVEVDLV